MKQLLLFILILPIVGFSQCPPTGGIFTSQSEIDALSIDYPNCTEVNAFSISGDDITDLSGLNQLVSCTSFGIGPTLVLQNTMGLNSNILIRYVEGTGTSFSITNNGSLLTLDGLENLNSQSGFESSFSISNNPMLLSVEGAPNIFSPLTYFYIENNDALLNLYGLENYAAGEYTSISNNDSLIDLTGLDEIYGETVRISNNDNLASLNGLFNSGFDDYLYIEGNQNLTDISAIFAGSYNDDGLIIRNNPNLSICSTDSVCFFIDSNIEEGVMLPGIFENNAPGCNSNFEVENFCGVNSNDDCGYTINFLTLGELITANNEFATTSLQTPSCDDIDNRKDVWFAFNSESNTTIDVIIQAGFYAQLWDSNSAFADCDNLNLVENACGTQLNDIPVTPNMFYYIQVWNDDPANRGGSSWFDLTVQDGALSTPEFQRDLVSLYPNPVQNELHIQTNFTIEKVEVYNLLGQQVMVSNATTLHVSSLTDGLYLVKVFSNGSVFTHKIVKQ
ncbi:T9SS type A sorting domain-containing protein [Bizionia arctica]|nr:T9SS type A sorting domain-containing protein [Bizionia arctica]